LPLCQRREPDRSRSAAAKAGDMLKMEIVTGNGTSIGFTALWGPGKSHVFFPTGSGRQGVRPLFRPGVVKVKERSGALEQPPSSPGKPMIGGAWGGAGFHGAVLPVDKRPAPGAISKRPGNHQPANTGMFPPVHKDGTHMVHGRLHAAMPGTTAECKRDGRRSEFAATLKP